ncbi:MAG: hypothetical protein PHP82_03470 [Candidatus ainarchaeum sp.]|nr:hypothetical protein [Candidatus ainarchaeum sp.]
MPSKIKKFIKKDIPKLRYGIMHSRIGFNDGVSIVMEQVEKVMLQEMNIPKENIFYLVGKSKKISPQINENDIFLDNLNGNKLAVKNYSIGFGGTISEILEKEINIGKNIIEDFVKKNNIDVIIAHNTCHPVNFILSLSLSRYYRDFVKKNKKTPKYLLWWHDSHLERSQFLKPAFDVQRYLLQGVPGNFVEYIIFINSLQFKIAKSYFLNLSKVRKNFFEEISRNKDVIYNTTETFIDSFKDLKKFDNETKIFIKDFKLVDLLSEQNLNFDDLIFCLQHTRILKRKRIDFALKYCFELLNKINEKRKIKKSIYFLVSGMDTFDGSKKKIILLHKKLSYQNPNNKIILVFAEDNETSLLFEDYPRIFARLGGISTYFSEIEGFGNNLLEVLASGLIPIVYTYPVFKKDIAKYNFKLISLNKFEFSNGSINETIDILKNNRKRKIWVNMNLNTLKKYFSHEIINFKLMRAIIRKRTHK